MNRSGRTLALGLVLVCMAAGGAGAGELSQAGTYFAARKSAQVASIPFETLRVHPDRYRSSLIEIRGSVSGSARRTDGATLIISTPNLGTYMVDVGDDLAQQALDAGHTVRILAQVPEGTLVSHVRAVAVVSEFDAATYEAQAVRSAPAASAGGGKSRRTPPRRRVLASRGGAASRAAAVAGGEVLLVQQYAQAVIYFNRHLTWDEATRIAQSIIYYSRGYGLDARLVMAVVAVESNFNASAVSPKGAMGLGQLMPGTAMGLGVADPWSPEQNIAGATRLLRGHLDRFSGAGPTEQDIKLALACYNAGAGAVRKHGGIPPYRETRNYVQKVTRLYYQMCGQPPP